MVLCTVYDNCVVVIGFKNYLVSLKKNKIKLRRSLFVCALEDEGLTVLYFILSSWP